MEKALDFEQIITRAKQHGFTTPELLNAFTSGYVSKYNDYTIELDYPIILANEVLPKERE